MKKKQWYRTGPTVAVIVAIVAVAAALGWFLYQARQEAVDTAGFDKLASQTICAEEGVQLYLINEQYVFFSRRGGCPDNSYAYKLYGTTPEQELCEQHDSIAGPVTKCEDESKRSLFETIVKNQDQPNLGLGADYQIRRLH